jgi:hypothetical protein
VGLDIHIKTVPHSHIRAEGAGDWHVNNNGSVEVLVSDLDGSWESELAVAIHELVECYMCRDMDINDDDVTRFDMQFEQERANGKHSLEAESGDDMRSPYRKQHLAAIHVERAVCHALGLNWDVHNEYVCPI